MEPKSTSAPNATIISVKILIWEDYQYFGSEAGKFYSLGLSIYLSETLICPCWHANLHEIKTTKMCRLMRGLKAARAQLPPFPARSQSQPCKPQPPPCPQYETIVHHPLQMKHFVPPQKVLNHLQRPVLESIPPLHYLCWWKLYLFHCPPLSLPRISTLLWNSSGHYQAGKVYL